jgi:hypothetical protein
MFANDIPMGGGNGGISGEFVSGLCRTVRFNFVTAFHVPQNRQSYRDFLESCHAYEYKTG